MTPAVQDIEFGSLTRPTGNSVQRGGTFYERNQAGAGPSSAVFSYGTSSDDPLAGDWDGDGTDTVGITRGY